MIRLARILVSPRQVFDGMRDKATFAWPLWSILIVSFVCLLLIFINYDDVKAGVPQHDGTVADEVDLDLVFFMGTGAVVVWVWNVISTLCILLVWASYYWVAGKVLKLDTGWGKWWGFTCWTAVPAILGSIAEVLYFNLAGRDPYVSFALFPWFAWGGGPSLGLYWIPISFIWMLFIAVNGVMSWTDKNLWISLAIVLPIVVLFALQQIAVVALIY